MRWKVAGVMMCLFSLIGCSNDVEVPTPRPERGVEIDTPGGKAVVKDLVRNLDQEYVTASVLDGNVDVTFRLESIGDGTTTTGSAASLLDSAGNLLFSMETLVNNVTGEVTFTQSTSEDYMTISVIADDERVTERYDTNGDVATFNYPALSDDDQRRAVNYYRHGLPSANLPADVSEYIEQVGAFDAYYASHANTTLRDNPSGELLVQLMSSEPMMNLVVGDTPDPQKWQWLVDTCAAARACMLLVCRIAPSSLACWVCWAVSVICAIFSY